jgi:histidine triad (HIT) family protein
MDCIFCKIVCGEIPAYKLYEDETTLAILDINPITPGHTLLISKVHYPTLLETPPEVLSKIIKSSYPVVQAVVTEMRAEGYNLLLNNNRCAGQLIPHLHFHIIPRRANDDVHFHWSPRQAGSEELVQLADKIRRYLSLTGPTGSR